MLRKINKQREKIERLAAKENDAEEKLDALRQELAEEREALDEMEKEYLFSLMRERALSLEETIALLESGAADMPEDASEEKAEQEEISGMEDAAENIFTEDTTDDFEKEPDEEIMEADVEEEPDEEIAEENLAEGFSLPASEETETDDSFFSRFGKKEETGDDGFWQ